MTVHGAIDFVTWSEANVVLDDGQRIRFEPHQRRILNRALKLNSDGRLRYSTILYSCPKKSGKTTINACLVLWVAFELAPGTEIIVGANDQEQAEGRVFRMVKAFVQWTPALMSRVESLTKFEIRLKDGTSIRAITQDAASEAGSNHSLTSFDELWGYVSEKSRRFYEEMTPVPTLKNSFRFISTYAGFTGESDLLESLYKRGKAGRRIWKGLPCYQNSSLFCYWDSKARMPWQTDAYYKAQRAELRDLAFKRLHRNQWVRSESAFIDMSEYDECVHDSHAPIISNKALPVVIGVDASVKHDSTAVVTVTKKDDMVVLVDHRKWQPSKKEPIDLEHTVESYIKSLSRRFRIARVHYDPFQFHRSATILKRAGIVMHEFPQMQDRLTEMSQNLHDLIKYRRLLVYPAKDLRRHIENAVAKETPRGFRIVKEKRSHKIDLVIALAMACLGATKNTKRPARGVWGPEYEHLHQRRLNPSKTFPGMVDGSLRIVSQIDISELGKRR